MKDIASARSLLEFARDSCAPAWVSDRCRIAVADAVFSEVLNDDDGARLVPLTGVSDEVRVILEFVIEALNPLVEQVRLTGRVDSAVQRAAVEFAVNAYGLLGQLSQITALVRPMISCRPVPLLLAQLTLRKICEPPQGLAGRLRVEHPNSFSARFLAALLDREVYGRGREALDSLIGLRTAARDQGQSAIEQLCQGLFETASAMDVAALVQVRDVIDDLLGKSNRYHLYCDTVTLLREGRPDAALAQLNAQPREEDATWWQVAAMSHETAKHLDKAAECWDRACQLMPHPDMLNHFAGLSIQQRRFEDAIRALKTALVQSPDDFQILEQLAFAHTRLRQFPDACEIFKTLIRLQPDITRHKVNLALCQARSGDAISALASIDEVIDRSRPDIQCIGVRTEILNGLNRSVEAFEDLEKLKGELWAEPRFLVLYMDTAYRAGKDEIGHSAFQQLLTLQHSGTLAEPLLHPMSLDDIKRIGSERLRQSESLFGDVVRGKFPWLMTEGLIGIVADQAWHRRTQPLRWLPDDVPARGEWTVYSTNGFSVQKQLNGQTAVSQIGVPLPGDPVVADMSAIITLHRLGRLTQTANYFGKLVVPTSYGDLPIRNAQRLAPHQPSQEQQLRVIQSAVHRKMLTVVEEYTVDENLPLVDEYRGESAEDCFSLADVARVLRETQRLTSPQLDELARVCHRPIHETRQLPRDSPVMFAMSTLRTLARFDWFERVLTMVNWCVERTDYDDEVGELQTYEFRRSIYTAHQSMWQELTELRTTGKIELRDSPSCRRDPEADGDEVPPYFDAVLVANDLGLRLLADDRMCQAVVLNQRPESPDAAFGTDRVLLALEKHGDLTLDEVCNELIQLMRWRYRFLLPDARHLKCAAVRSRDNLPGPELREIAAYVQESMRDPGLFCGPEKADVPTPMAFNYFFVWNKVCVEFLAVLWDDAMFTREQLHTATGWCAKSLLPAVPRGMLYSPIGRRLGSFTPKAFMLTAMMRFALVQPLQRANEALRLLASELGMTDDEFYEAAAEAADGRTE